MIKSFTVLTLCGSILFLASVLKIVALFKAADEATVYSVIVIAEFIFGLLLIIKPRSYQLYLCSILTFCFFSVMHIYDLIQGREACSCLGDIQTPSIIALFFTMSVVFALIGWPIQKVTSLETI